MKKSLALLALGLALVASAATPAPVVTVDLYGNVFLDGANTNSQIGDFARNNPALAPQVDGAVRELVIAARARIAADTKVAQDAASAQIAAKESEKVAAIATAEKARDDAIAAHAASKAKEISDLKAEIERLKTEAAAKANADEAAAAAPAK